MNLSDFLTPEKLRSLSHGELRELAEEIRGTIIETVTQNGGHLASNLGVVELTIALHRVLNCPKDKIVFDVGHQCYAHKILTGRYDRFSTLRQMDGICGFPRREESVFDVYETGHASTAISAALGMARARDMLGQDYRIAAVVGDGAMTGGMCYEALNDAGSRQTSIMVVLNDNEMSISRNVGALSKQLTKLRVSRGWLGAKKTITEMLKKAPFGGKTMYKAFQRVKNSVRNVLIKDKFFTALGFRYFGPIDGHDIEGMEKVFRQLSGYDKPVVVHVVTKKGLGYQQAEERPDKYHGVSPAPKPDEEEGELVGCPAGKQAGNYITQLAEKNNKLCVITAAMADSAGFHDFSVTYPDRFFDVGIAEEHAVTLSAGMACGGMRPIVAVYETFLQRAYDQIIEDICLQRLPVCLLMDRAGLGGEDGATHHGIFGVSMLRSIPGLTLLEPAGEKELEGMIDWAIGQDGPCAIRYPRALPYLSCPEKQFVFGQWSVLRPGGDVAILAGSAILDECLLAAELLSKRGIQASVINASTLRPLDGNCLKNLSKKGTAFVTVEEHILSGGFGCAVAEYCAREGLSAPKAMIGLPDMFIPHGKRSQLLKRYRLDHESLANQIQKAVEK